MGKWNYTYVQTFTPVIKELMKKKERKKERKKTRGGSRRFIHFYNHEHIPLKTGAAPLSLRHSA